MSFTNFTGARPPFGNIVQPGAYSVIDASALANNQAFSRTPIPMVLGVATGGVPKTPMYFSSPGAAHQVLRSGAGHDMVQHVFAGGAPVVGCVRVGNSPSQSSLALAGSGGTALTVTSLDYGSWTTGIKIAVASGPILTITYTDTYGTAYTEKWDFTGVGGLTLAQIVQAITGDPSPLYGFQPSSFISAAVGAGSLPLSTVSASALTGGLDGTSPVAQDWTDGLTAIETEQIDIVVPASGDASVHAQVLTHCRNMSAATARHERTMCVGGVLNETPDQVISRAGALRDKRVQLVYPGLTDYGSAGNLVSFDPFYAAGRLAGMHCSLPDQATALTHKSFPCTSLERALSSVQGGDLDKLLLAGVTPLAKAPISGYWVVDSLSTWNTDVVFRDFHKIRSADAVAAQMRYTLESSYVGGKNLAGTAEAIGITANAALDDMVAQGLIRAYQATAVDQGNDLSTFMVTLSVMLVDANKFIFITVLLQPSSALNAQTTATQ